MYLVTYPGVILACSVLLAGTKPDNPQTTVTDTATAAVIVDTADRRRLRYKETGIPRYRTLVKQ